MEILLDIDGVLVTTPSWKPVEIHTDGFMKFNEQAAQHLAKLVHDTNASIILTTTHRIHYSVAEWNALLQERGIYPTSVLKLNNAQTTAELKTRSAEIEHWVKSQDTIGNFVILDDDLSLHGLPISIKRKWVQTKPLIGLDATATDKALQILNGY